MTRFRTWLVCDPRQAIVLSNEPISASFSFYVQDDPSFRHWASRDGRGFTVIDVECSIRDEKILARNNIRAKELLLIGDNVESADNFLSLIHAGILLAYPKNLGFSPVSSTHDASGIDATLLRRDPIHKWFTYHEDVGYGCLIARRAWTNRNVRYAIHKWRLSIDLDSFTPHSASPHYGQVFPTNYPDDTYHVKAAFAVNSAFSAIEELGLEVRSSEQNPRFVGEKKDTWNPNVYENIGERLSLIGVGPNEEFEWIIRGEERAIEKKLKPSLGRFSPCANGNDVRDRTITIADAIHYSSVVRNFITAHRLHSLVGEIGPYDVFNMQSLSRRLILSSLSAWKKDFDQIAEEDKEAEQDGGGNVANAPRHT